MKIAPVLKRVLKLFEDDDHWTRGIMARDKKGWPCRAKSRNAECWCMMGAVMKVSVDPMPVLYFMEEHMPNYCSISSWNDNRKRTVKQVRRKLEQMIKSAEARGI